MHHWARLHGCGLIWVCNVYVLHAWTCDSYLKFPFHLRTVCKLGVDLLHYVSVSQLARRAHVQVQGLSIVFSVIYYHYFTITSCITGIACNNRRADVSRKGSLHETETLTTELSWYSHLIQLLHHLHTNRIWWHKSLCEVWEYVCCTKAEILRGLLCLLGLLITVSVISTCLVKCCAHSTIVAWVHGYSATLYTCTL